MTTHALTLLKHLIYNIKFSVTIETEKRAKNKSNNNLEANEDANEPTWAFSKIRHAPQPLRNQWKE